MKIENMPTSALKIDQSHLRKKIEDYKGKIVELGMLDNDEIQERIIDFQQGIMDCENLLVKIDAILKIREPG